MKPEFIVLAFIALNSVCYGQTTYKQSTNWITDYVEKGGDILDVTGLKVPEGWPTQARRNIDDVLRPTIGLPDHWDWREHGMVREARTQGRCGSCWAFATSGITEIVWQLLHPNLSSQPPLLLSPQSLVNCTENNCQGGWFDAPLNYAQYHGLSYETEEPYTGYQAWCRQTPGHVRVTRWAYVAPPGYEPSIDMLKQAIYDHGPIAVSVAADANWMRYDRGIYNDCARLMVNHMVILTGWHTDGNGNGGGYWYVLNSWGPQWGEKGYMRSAYVGYGGAKCNSLGQTAAYAVIDGVENLRAYLGL